MSEATLAVAALAGRARPRSGSNFASVNLFLAQEVLGISVLRDDVFGPPERSLLQRIPQLVQSRLRNHLFLLCLVLLNTLFPDWLEASLFLIQLRRRAATAESIRVILLPAHCFVDVG